MEKEKQKGTMDKDDWKSWPQTESAWGHVCMQAQAVRGEREPFLPDNQGHVQ